MKSINMKKKPERVNENRVELHLHTKMSAMDGLIDAGEAITRAAQWGHPAIAVTDHGVVHSFPAAYKTAERIKTESGKNIKVLYGMECYIRIGFPSSETLEKTPIYHAVLLAKNKIGLKNLYKLVSISHTEHFDMHCKRPIIYKSVLEEQRDGLLIGSACARGELFAAIMSETKDEELQNIARFYDYLEIQPLCNYTHILHLENSAAKSEDDILAFSKKVIELGELMDIPVVAASNAHFLDPEDEICRKIILTGRGYDVVNDKHPLYLRTTEQMLDEFSYLGNDIAYKAVVSNTNLIAGICEEMDPLPPKEYYYAPYLEGSRHELEHIVARRFHSLYSHSYPQIADDRANSELNNIVSWGHDVNFVAAHKLVAYLENEGCNVSPRGGIASSFIAYLAGITDINPLPAHYRCPNCKRTEFPDMRLTPYICAANLQSRSAFSCGADLPEKLCPYCGISYIRDGFNIPVETFFGIDGEKIPQIQLSVPGEYIEKAREFIRKLFGSENVLRAGTVLTINKKHAGMLVDSYMKSTGRRNTLASRLCQIKSCTGVKQMTGRHPGKLIIIPQNMDVTDFSPVQYPAGLHEKDSLITHFNYHTLDENLMSIDLLGHDSPAMLAKLEAMTEINASEIRFDDTFTLSIFTSPACLGLPKDDETIGKTGTLGIPGFCSTDARQILCELSPRNFSGLIRTLGFVYGDGVWHNNAKELIDKGKAKIEDTISNCDDIMLYLSAKGPGLKEAFEISESVRKGRGIPEETLTKLHNTDIPEWYIDSCNKIKYLFPKAHLVAYALTAFRIAWYKVHKPLEYYSVYFELRKQNGAFDADVMTRDIESVAAEIFRINSSDYITSRNEALLETLKSCYEFYMRGFSFDNLKY